MKRSAEINSIYGIHVLTDHAAAATQGRTALEVALEAVRGGASVIQLRDKEASHEQLLVSGKELITMINGAYLIVNDYPAVAKKIDADGVHVGQDDEEATVARTIIGEDLILGVSATTVYEAQTAQKHGATYLGVGPVLKTTSKPNAVPPIGIEGLKKIIDAVSLPVVAIGGITAETLPTIMERCPRLAGAAVIGAVGRASDPEQATRKLVEIYNAYKK